MNKPVAAKDVTLNGATHIVVIGDEAWVGQVGGELKSTPGGIVTGLFASYDPTLLVAAFSGPVWAESAADKGTEQKNGVSTTHYRIDGTTLANGFSGLPAGASIDSWIADDGYCHRAGDDGLAERRPEHPGDQRRRSGQQGRSPELSRPPGAVGPLDPIAVGTRPAGEAA